MKKTCLIILILSLISITAITIYTLTHQTIKGAKEIIKTKSIEQASSNLTENELSEIYNVELNGKRHRLKSNYRVEMGEENAKVTLTLYLDGFEILKLDILNNLPLKNINELFQNQITNFKTITESSIEIIKTDQDYLAVSINSQIDSLKEEYFIWNSDGDILLKNITIYDESQNYISTNEEQLNIFYDDKKNVMAKIENNALYAIEPKEIKDTLVLEENIYNLKKGKVYKKRLNTYENVTLASENKK